MHPIAPVRIVPSQLPPDARARLAPVLALVGKVRQRFWLLRAADRLLLAASAVGVVLAVCAVLVRSGWISADADTVVLGILGVLVVAAGAWIAAHRLDWFAAARLIDRRADAKDRVATALELAVRPANSGWTQVQAADALRFAAGVQAHQMVPLRRPVGVLRALFAGALVAVAVYAPLPWLVLAAHPEAALAVDLELPHSRPAIVAVAELLSKDDKEIMALDQALLADMQAQVDDPKTRAWLGKLRATIDDVQQGRVTKRDALARLAELEKSAPAPSDHGTDQQGGDDRAPGHGGSGAPGSGQQAAGAQQNGTKQASDAAGRTSAQQQADKDRAVRSQVSQALKDSLKSAPKGAEADQLRKAADNKDMGAIAKWVRKMAEKAASKDMSDKDLEKWIKVAEKFAKQLGDTKIAQKHDALRQRIERLQRKRRQQGGLAGHDRTRLKNTRRDLQALQRKHGDTAAAKYQLQRLQRNAKSAMDQLRRQHKSRLGKRGDNKAQDEARRQRRKQFAKDMQRASGEMRRMSDQQKQRQAQRIGQSRIQQTREALSRAGRKRSSREEFERQARQQGAAKAKQGGDKGQQGKPGDRMKTAKQGGRSAAEKRAAQQAKAGKQGQQGKNGQNGNKGGKNGKPSFKLGGSDMPEDPRMAMMRKAGGAQNPSSKSGGNQAGAGDDEGGGKQPRGKRIGVGRRERVTGVDGEGPTVKQVFVDAAKKGFVRQRWQRVYRDYSEVAEEMAARQGLPIGRKRLVRRYFEQIRPREIAEP